MCLVGTLRRGTRLKLLCFILLLLTMANMHMYRSLWRSDVGLPGGESIAEETGEQGSGEPDDGLADIRITLEAKRLDVRSSVNAIYYIIAIIPLSAAIYLLASLIQSMSSISLTSRGDSKADLAKGRAIRAKREAEESEWFDT